MHVTFQYRLLPTPEQKLELNYWLRVCRYWYNRQLGDRFDWWEKNRCPVNACPLICHLPKLRDKPGYYSQKKYLPELKKDLISVGNQSELLDISRVPANTLQEVCKRVDEAFERYICGDANGKLSGKPRFKSDSRFRSLIFAGKGLELHSCSVGGKFLYLKTPKLSLVKVRTHRHLPDGAILKQAQFIKKADGWYINLNLEEQVTSVLCLDQVKATWENSVGIDAVLHGNDFLATSEGEKLPALKSFRKSESRLVKVSKLKSLRRKGSQARRKLAKRQSKECQRTSRARRDHAFKTAHSLVSTGNQVFFCEKLNLRGLTNRNAPRQDEQGAYLPNSQSAKSGLNKSWSDAGFGQFFSILEYIASKAGAKVVPINPSYTSQLLAYRNDFVFTDCGVRLYWDDKEKLWVDRDINAAINIKRVGLDVFPTINCRRGKPIVVASTTDSTSKEVLPVLRQQTVGKLVL